MPDDHRPPLPAQHQDETPGRNAPMDPQPDCGEASYRGSGHLAGKAAIVTGGDSGIGRAVALAFPNEEDAAETARLVEAAGRRALRIGGDIAKAAQRRRIVEEMTKAFGRIAILVNAATWQRTQKSLDKISDEEWDHIFDVNIGAMFRITMAALSHTKPGAAIIGPASVDVDTPKPKLVPCLATKAAIQNVTAASRNCWRRGGFAPVAWRPVPSRRR